MSWSGAPADGPPDSVDRLLEGWARAAPDLDLAPVAIVARLGRLRRIIETELEATYAEHGLNGADFSALVTLRRLERPGGVPQSQLMRELNLTSGTISVRVERLCGRGLVGRSPDPADHRNSLLTLTPAGLRLFEQVAPAHVATESRLLAALNVEQREQLAGLLRQLLVSFEGSTAQGATPRLGVTLAPAHTTLAIRRAVGLPDVLGLLVRSVEEGGPAAQAGIRVGDVLVRAQERDLRSVTTLYAALKEARPAGRVRLEGVRGADDRFEAVVGLRAGPRHEAWPARTAVTEAAVHTL
jgi:DNA-binding MarR family transcriptional regulator